MVAAIPPHTKQSVNLLPATVALCFFGITRSLRFTLPSIEVNILQPLTRATATSGRQLRTYAHFFDQARIDNPRSGESGEMVSGEHLLLATDWLRLETPDLCLEAWKFEQIKTFGDRWSDDFYSLRNLVHQLHSLRQATLVALESGAEIALFCRPDLRYHDSLGPAIARALHNPRRDLVQLPGWQSWAGLNDRFAVVSGRHAIRTYGCRIELALSFCQNLKRPLHAEELLLYAMDEGDVPLRTMCERASRVRLDGTEKAESFSLPGRRSRVKAWIRNLQRTCEKYLGIRRPLRLAAIMAPDPVIPSGQDRT